jgi:hypothetical protein
VLFLVYGAQEYVLSRENAGRHYYVFLAFDREGHWEADEQISSRSEDYLNSHRALFSGLDVKVKVVPMIVPDDFKNLKTLPYRTADLDKVALRVMHFLGRSSFCPALVLGTRLNVSSAPRVVLRSALYAVTADTKLRPGKTDAFVLEGDDDMHYFALLSTLKLMQTLRGLSCRATDGVVTATETPGSLALPVETENEVKRRLLEEYYALLDVSDRRAGLAPLARDVQQAIDAKKTDDATVQALLDRYVEVEPPAVDAERQRRGLLAKPGALKKP